MPDCLSGGEGSNPSRTANNGPIAQMARAPALHAGGREFESHWVHNSAPVAKLVDATGLSPVSH